jgi:hypothetical protein
LEHGAVEGKQIAKGEKVTAVVPGVEKGAEIAAGTVVAVQILATTIHNINIPKRLAAAGRTAPIFRIVLISGGGSAILSTRSRSARKTITGG